MRPERYSNQLFGAIRARAKMHEFRAAEADFNAMRRDPSSLLALAIGILGDAAAALSDQFISPTTEDGRPKTWEEADGSVPDMVRFSARYFDAFLDAQFDQDITNELSLLCATSYYLSDSVGSAAVVMRRSEPPAIQLGHGLARLAYKILSHSFDPIDEAFFYRDFSAELLSTLQRFYAMEDVAEQLRTLCNHLKRWVYSSGSARELLYADVVVALCARKLDSASATILPPASGLPPTAWASALLKEGFPTELWPAQKLLCAEGILEGRSAVIQMPTSAGKTRATEFIIRSHFLARRSALVVIVAPFRSLCHDIRSDLVKAFAGENVLIDEVSDSYLFDIDLNEIREQNSVFVVTPEKLLYMLRRAPELAETIGLAIYDEGHQFDGLARGPTYELLLASMRISLPPEAQVILISAVIGNAHQIAEWLIGDRDAVVFGRNLLPTVRNIAFASWQHERAWLKYVSPQDPDAEEFFVPRIIESKKLTLKKREWKAKYFPERGTTRSNTDVGLFLGLHLVNNGSVAIFCGTKEGVGTVCKRAVEIHSRGLDIGWPLNCSNIQEVAKVANLVRLHLGVTSEAAKAAELGIFSHRSNTPPGIRLSIEHAMKVGLARMVVCTSTLAQGVNFPIRYLIVTSTQQGHEEIKIRDFHNLMGRAGRAGMYTEGNVIFSAPSLIDEKAGDGRRRWDKTKHLLDPTNSEPSTSSILDLFAVYEQRREGRSPLRLTIPADWLDLAFATKESIAAQTAIAVKRFPEIKPKEFTKFVTYRARAVQSIAAYLASYVDFESDLAGERVNELARNTLAYYLADDETRQRLLAVFHAAAKAIESGADLGLIKLIRKSPLPPADVKRLSEWVTANSTALLELGSNDELLSALIGQALLHAHSAALSSIPKSQVLECLSAWLKGKSYDEIRIPLTAAGVKIGNSRATAEHVVHLCESGFGYDLSMVVAAIADLVEESSEELNGRLVAVQKRIKYGLSSPGAIAFFEAGFADRIVAQTLSAAFPTAKDKSDVRRICRRDAENVVGVLAPFPAYFTYVAGELRAARTVSLNSPPSVNNEQRR
jgi:superfamily II DNA/RNA helicase